MTQYSRQTRRSPSRTFRPVLDDGRLEDRFLLSQAGKRAQTVSHYLLNKNNTPRAAYNLKMPPFLTRNAPKFHRDFKVIKAIGTQTAHGGQAVEVTATDGSHYRVKLSYTSNTLATNVSEGQNGQAGVSSTSAVVSQVSQQNVNYPQPIGTVRAYPMTGGRVGIIVDGSTDNTELTINPLGHPQRKGYAHSFAYGESDRGHVLKVGKIVINSGRIGGIEGFHTADLSGPLISTGTTAIDRIAFNSILPGASIDTGGDVNTLDVLNGIELSGTDRLTGKVTGIHIGRDLNLLNVGTDIKLSDGASITVGRDLGLVNQPPKGTGTGTNVLLLNFNTLQNITVSQLSIPGPVGGFIQGNVFINDGSTFSVGRNIVNPLYIEGHIDGFSRVLVNTATTPRAPTFLTALPQVSSLQDNIVVALGGGIP